MENNFVDYWNNFYKKYKNEPIGYDNWLDKYEELYKNINTEILDLGCGGGNDTLYLINKQKKVLSADYSMDALNKINLQIDGAKTICLDIAKPLPFKNDSFELIIADLSLHYFDKETTIKIMQEIKRVLKNKGVLLARVNSTKDINFGSINGKEIEKDFYFVNGYNKRFFTIKTATEIFNIVGATQILENTMNRYTKTKHLLEVMATKE